MGPQIEHVYRMSDNKITKAALIYRPRTKLYWDVQWKGGLITLAGICITTYCMKCRITAATAASSSATTATAIAYYQLLKSQQLRN